MSETFCPECGRVHEPYPGPCTRPSLLGQALPDGLVVRERVGETSMGVVYRAESPEHRELQLVFLSTGPGTESAQLHAQLARATAITHPNVAAIRGVGETPDGVRYVAFEVFRGQLLSEILQVRSVLPVEEAVDLILQAAAGLQATHEAGVLHGSLSPETILVARGDDGPPAVKLIRFGLTEPESGGSGAGEARMRYRAPERIAGHPPSIPGDVFSLGAVLHHLLTGHPPGDVRSLPPGLPSGIQAALTGALDPAPEHRIQSVAVFSWFLQAYRLADATAGERSALGRRAGLRTRVLVGMAAAIVVGTAWWALHRTPESKPTRPPADEGKVSVSPSVPTPASPAPRHASDTVAARAEQPASRPAPTPSRRAPARSQPARPIQEAKPKPVAAERPESLATGPSMGDTSRAIPMPEERPRRLTVAEEPSGRAPPSAQPAPMPMRPVPPRPAAPPRDAVAEAREAAGRTLATYARALESSDLHAVEWIYPGITDRERAAWKKFFEVARDLVVTLNIERLALTGSEARLDVEGTYRYWNRTLLRPEVAPVRFLATVRRDGDTWHLSAIR